MHCPFCKSDKKVVKKGRYKRQQDRKIVQRYYCKSCGKGFSSQTNAIDYRHRKSHINQMVFNGLSKGLSQRACAYIIGVKPQTIARRVTRFGKVCQKNLDIYRSQRSNIENLFFDELETMEHSKCKPLTVPIAVEKDSRKVLFVDVGSIAAKGHLAEISRKRYGQRKCERRTLLTKLLSSLKASCKPKVKILTDMSHHYPKLIENLLPEALHATTKGRRGCVVGQGELKKGGFDPLFSLNHTYAMFRDNLKTLSRRTWCTCKKVERLRDLLHIYAWAHNLRLDQPKKRAKLTILRIN